MPAQSPELVLSIRFPGAKKHADVKEAVDQELLRSDEDGYEVAIKKRERVPQVLQPNQAAAD